MKDLNHAVMMLLEVVKIVRNGMEDIIEIMDSEILKIVSGIDRELHAPLIVVIGDTITINLVTTMEIAMVIERSIANVGE